MYKTERNSIKRFAILKILNQTKNSNLLEWSTIVAEAVNGVWCDLIRPMIGINSTKATRANIPAKDALQIPMSVFTTPGEVDQEETPTQSKVCDITSADDSIK
ncbi:uncharacterized protein LOC119769446 isoform X1 [Culex quinquefasciatus]|uniref:uncharacterized protein LOC119765412 isoform X1 n=1 Tax=Culex quinquefasciatus TaxID=7176 RepID=UPI0018E2E59D|nr:uncharacterized protein LOC119765412 isoform X1 [Culex quinquefasciatus]XP_038117828.1 uncharacterized protein LOC119769446 isoform X1 [Culex quinquefasciatus]